MHHRLRAAVVATALAFTPAAALAQAAVVVPERPVVVIPDRPLTVDDAREIAAMNGVNRIESIDHNRLFGRWEINGYDTANRYVEMDIDTNTGAITRLDR